MDIIGEKKILADIQKELRGLRDFEGAHPKIHWRTLSDLEILQSI